MKTLTILVTLYTCPAQAEQERTSGPAGETTLQRLEREISSVIEKVRPSVVKVSAAVPVEPDKTPEWLTLSGVIYSREGHIVTDASGVESAGEIKVTSGSRVFKAQHVGSDRRTGVAVLRVAAGDLKPAPFAPEACKTGSAAIAVGNAFGGSPGGSFGTVGGVRCTIVVSGRRYDDMIQMTAPVQPGDCGGYVADSSGRFIGLVHSVYAPDPAGGDLAEKFGKAARDLLATGARNVSFATPSDWVRFSADRIIKHGRMVRGWAGLSARPLDEAARAQLGLPEGEGAEVVRVDREGPAARARLAPRDVLLTFDGQPVRDLDDLQWKVARVEQPRNVRITYLRNRERHEADLRVEIDPQR